MRSFHFINDTNVCNGGAQRVVRLLHEYHLKQGVDTNIVSLKPNIEEPIESFSCLNVNSVYSVDAIRKVRSYLQEHCNQSDTVVHSHLFPTNLWTANGVATGKRKFHLLCTEHSTSNNRRKKWYGKWIDRWIYPNYDRIFCISKATEESIHHWLPSTQQKTEVIENGTELYFDEFPACRKSNQYPVVASAGRLSEPKNYESALKALAQLKDLHFKYRIAGTGPLESDLKKLTIQLGLQDKVEFVGFVSDLKSFLTEADVFLMPSLWEGFGLSAVEAMNAGLPVVASNVCGLNEVVDSSCGLVVPPTNIDQIALAVRELLTSQDLRTKFGKAGFNRSLQFSAERMADRYLESYQRIINSP